MSEQAGLTRRSVTAAFLGGATALILGPPAIRAALAAGPPSGVLFEMPLGDLPAMADAASAATRAHEWRSGPLRSPVRFDLLGVEWESPPGAGIELRVWRAAGWSPWVKARQAHAPDGPPGPRLISDPIWAGGADALELRAGAPVRGVLVHLVNSTGSATVSDRALGGLRRLAASASRPLAQPHLPAGPGQPPILARSSWAGPREHPNRRAGYGQVRLGFVHHTENANDYRPGQSAAIVRAIFHYHRDVKGWHDIGYNFLIDKYGQIFEGRAGGIDEAVVGAQAGGYNIHSTGVGNLGSFHNVRESTSGIRALAHLMAWKLSLHGVPVSGEVTVHVDPAGAPYSRFPARAPVTLKRISGHRDADSTDCPGNALYHQLPGLRALARELAGRPAQLTVAGLAPPPAGPGAEQVAGRLAYLDGTPVAGVAIEVRGRTGATERTLTTATTQADGSWSAAITLAGRLSVRAVFRGDGTHPAAVSDRVDLAAGGLGARG